MGIKRYPGALPFNSKQENIFYGRDKDIKRLLTLIQVEKQVLLYSKSGLGKTSLLEAGVIPKLPKNYIPVSIRFYAYSEKDQERELQFSPIVNVINTLKSVIAGFDSTSETVLDKLIENGKEAELFEKGKEQKSLWYHFKRLQLQNNASENEEQERKIYLLVFDQFEELFSYPPEQVTEFKNQFHELTRLTVPDNFEELISFSWRKSRELLDKQTISKLHQKINVKTVFAIRSDKLSLLNRLTDKIKDIHKIFKVIFPLDSVQAGEAVTKPAEDEGSDFETPSFEYHKEALKKIVDELTNFGKQALETTQLQIVCQRIEEDVAKKYADNPGSEKIIVKVNDLPDFNNIFDEFYQNSIKKLPKDQRDKAERFVEGELIRNQQRISLDEEVCKDYVDENTLKILVNTHLLRAERNSFGRISYELSHDTLIDPISKSQEKYEAEQAALEAKKKRIEKQKVKDEKQKKKAKVQKTILVIVSICLLISLGFGYYGYYQAKKAKKALEDLKTQQYDAAFKEGKSFMELPDYKNASDWFRSALIIKYDSINKADSAYKLMKICEHKHGDKPTYDSLKKLADTNIFYKKYHKAMIEYNTAFDMDYDTTEIINNKKDLFIMAIAYFEEDSIDYTEWGNSDKLKQTITRLDSLRGLYKNK